MKKKLLLVGPFLFILSVAIGLYASRRNCLFGFLASGHLNFWTSIELLAGVGCLLGVILTLIGCVRAKGDR
ncbi:MAG: hypothetical protein GWO20_17870 [Candidatus Korarchaeota archaeon]|nr:hypothetical protein [Candidatus Korarchaeota archaeon]NIW15272.1 hypothetical protein [Candidatus Thorarchaeota archaeon]